jgi:hypothetical protein
MKTHVVRKEFVVDFLDVVGPEAEMSAARVARFVIYHRLACRCELHKFQTVVSKVKDPLGPK